MTTPHHGKHLPNTVSTTLLWAVVGVLLLVPAWLGFVDIDDGALVLRCIVASVGVLAVLIASSRFALRGSGRWAVFAAVVILAIVFTRALFAALVRFSGQDFGTEFFMHLEPESVRVAWNQYRWEFILLGASFVVLIAAFIFAARRVWHPSRRLATVLLALGAVFIVAGHAGMPEWRLAHGAFEWFVPSKLDVPAVNMEAWRSSPLLTTDITTKQRLTAQPAAPPKNIILLYIEAGGVAMAPAQHVPDLMPNMQRLIAEHSFVESIHASSFVTIEGLVNTLCGTLYPFERGSASMAGFDSMLEQMPCLGDVLSTAGYQQSFLGGADTVFAGKGKFLQVHGYDSVVGSVEWAQRGIAHRGDDWGVSDADLFSQSFTELQRLKQSGHPYNLTLLTIGTHLPGFIYKECTPYGNGAERFLSAVHCTDQLVGQWVDKLRADGWLDENTILVITGDHQVFPNPEMKRLFGDKAVADIRLPLIVIGKNLPVAAARDGAGYDIAPTVLDLLGVGTNARFSLGRSLVHDNRTLDQFFSRFSDSLGEQRYVPGNDYDCSGGKPRIPGIVPLSRCERDQLSSILIAQATRYSAPPQQMHCNSEAPLHVMVPTMIGEPLQINLSGSDQADRFIWQERQKDPIGPGLYVLTMDMHGKVLERNYTPPTPAMTMTSLTPKLRGAAAALVVWRPDPKLKLFPPWLGALGIDAIGGSWLFTVQGDNVSEPIAHAPLGAPINISNSQCDSLLPDNSAD